MDERRVPVTTTKETICCRFCEGLGVCYLVCLVAPVVLLLGVLLLALASLLGYG